MDIDPAIPPSGSGCVECLASGGWWLHLRRCAGGGHIGCCDSSPSQHASHHAADTGHPIIQSYEPGEEWFWDYAMQQFWNGPELAPPRHHPLDQPVPGPAGRVPRRRDDCTDMTTIGFLGSGNLGGTVARLASAEADIDQDTRTVPDFADAIRRHEVIAGDREVSSIGGPRQAVAQMLRLQHFRAVSTCRNGHLSFDEWVRRQKSEPITMRKL